MVNPREVGHPRVIVGNSRRRIMPTLMSRKIERIQSFVGHPEAAGLGIGHTKTSGTAIGTIYPRVNLTNLTIWKDPPILMAMFNRFQ